MTDLVDKLERDLAEAERKAWDALARWKFWMFGYHASDVIKIKRLLGRGREPFFKPLVEAARQVMAQRYLTPIGCGDAYLIYSVLYGAWWRPDRAGYTTDLRQAGRYSREEAIDQCATGRDGYTGHMIPSDVPIRLDEAMMAPPGAGYRDMMRLEDDAECKARDKARRSAVTA